MLEWCSITESTISSPSPIWARPKLAATRLIASVAERVKTISSLEAALRKRAHALARAPRRLRSRRWRDNAGRDGRWRIRARRRASCARSPRAASAPRRRCRDRRAACRRAARRGSGNPRGSPRRRRGARGAFMDRHARLLRARRARRASSTAGCRAELAFADARRSPRRRRPRAASLRPRAAACRAPADRRPARVERADRRAVAADDVVGEDLQLRLVVHRAPVGESRIAWRLHGAVGLLRAGPDDDLALEHAGRRRRPRCGGRIRGSRRCGAAWTTSSVVSAWWRPSSKSEAAERRFAPARRRAWRKSAAARAPPPATKPKASSSALSARCAMRLSTCRPAPSSIEATCVDLGARRRGRSRSSAWSLRARRRAPTNASRRGRRARRRRARRRARE